MITATIANHVIINVVSYCMVVSNTQLEGSVFNESSDEDIMM